MSLKSQLSSLKTGLAKMTKNLCRNHRSFPVVAPTNFLKVTLVTEVALQIFKLRQYLIFHSYFLFICINVYVLLYTGVTLIFDFWVLTIAILKMPCHCFVNQFGVQTSTPYSECRLCRPRLCRPNIGVVSPQHISCVAPSSKLCRPIEVKY